MSDGMMYLKPKGEVMRSSISAMNRFTKKVEYLKDGGVLTYFWGEAYPEKQLVYPEMFPVLNPVKRVLPAFLRAIKRSHLLKFLLALSFLPGGKTLRRELKSFYVSVFWSGMHLVAFKPEHYCVSGKELRRALIETFGAAENSENEQLIDIVCLFWEYDNAYRTRGQDFFGIIDRRAFLLDPVKEATRVLVEYSKRDLVLREKINLFRPLILFLLYLPKTRKAACKFINLVDLEKLKLDLADRYWCYHRTDYNADGLPLSERMKKRNLMKLG
jgi:hypothetical protein